MTLSAVATRIKAIKNKRLVALIVVFVIGLVMVLHGVEVGYRIGAMWIGKEDPWRMNNYVIVSCDFAFKYFTILLLFLGGFLCGVVVPIFFVKRASRRALMVCLVAFFATILTSGLGFNTGDFLLGYWYFPNNQQPPPVVMNAHLPLTEIPLGFSVTIEAWNYYFFMFDFSIWVGAFLIGITTSVIILVLLYMRRQRK